MKPLYWLKDNIRIVLMVFAAIEAVGTGVLKYMEEVPGQTDWNGVLMAGGVALFAYLKKAPGDLTASQAKEKAEAHAAEAVRKSMSPPPSSD